jgi:hypothetical protein
VLLCTFTLRLLNCGYNFGSVGYKDGDGKAALLLLLVQRCQEHLPLTENVIIFISEVQACYFGRMTICGSCLMVNTKAERFIPVGME